MASKANALPAPVTASFTEATDLVAEPNEAVATALTVDAGAYGAAGAADLVYSATAEDNGTAGEMDGQPGLIASGIPEGIRVPVRVNIDNLDLNAGIETPEASDTFVVAVAVNSEVQASSDEGFSAGNAEALHNLDTTVYVAQNDVIRVAVVGGASNEAGRGVDVDASGELTIS